MPSDSENFETLVPLILKESLRFLVDFFLMSKVPFGSASLNIYKLVISIAVKNVLFLWKSASGSFSGSGSICLPGYDGTFNILFYDKNFTLCFLIVV
jgi:hypothetical protein